MKKLHYKLNKRSDASGSTSATASVCQDSADEDAEQPRRLGGTPAVPLSLGSPLDEYIHGNTMLTENLEVRLRAAERLDASLKLEQSVNASMMVCFLSEHNNPVIEV